MRESGQFLGAEPEDGDDERVTVEHDDDRQNEHDEQLIPGEHDAVLVSAYVRVGAGQRGHVTLVVVVQAFSCILSYKNVHQPTHASKIMDTVFTIRPDIPENYSVIPSTIPTKHKSILLNCSRESFKQDSQTKRVIQFYGVREQYIDSLNMALHIYNWTHLLIDRDLNCVYKAFFDVI